MPLQRHIKLELPPSHAFAAWHKGRYEWAAQHLIGPTLDAACGYGMGTVMLAKHQPTVGVDNDPECILKAANYFNQGVIAYVCEDIAKHEWLDSFEGFETIVSIETIEHLREPRPVLLHFYNALPAGGRFIGTTPNENKYSFDPKQFEGDPSPHFRHYRPHELEQLLAETGFKIEEWWTQHGSIHYNSEGKQIGKQVEPEMVRGMDGLFVGFVATAI